MPLLVKARSFLRNLFSSRRLETDLDKEVQSHLEMLVEENIRSGMPLEEAKRCARIELGGIEQVKERVREERVGNWLHSVILDFRFGLRQLRKNPGFASVAVLTLALGIAVNATMFSLVSAFLLRRPPGQQPERVSVITSVSPTTAFQADANPVSVPNYLAWRAANHVFANMAASDEYRTVNLTLQGRAEALRAAAVSANYFDVFGVSPQLGRTFSDQEDTSGLDHVVVLSHELWTRHFRSDPSLVGRTIRLNRVNYTVIGVMPPSFHLLGFTPQLWMPLVFTPADRTAAARKDHSLYLFGRLRSAVTLEEARAELVALARRGEESFPDTEKGWKVAVRTLPDFLIYEFRVRSALAIIMTTVGFVLMIACANVAGLLLARASGRRKEFAIRIALGAGNSRIVRQLLTENLLIALFGGGLGLLLAYWGIHLVGASLTFNEAISAVPLSLDRNVLLFVVGVSLISAVLSGLAPALNATRSDININLKGEGRSTSASRSSTRLRSVMVTGEIALALFLLLGSGLLFRAISLIEHQNLGFRADHLLTANVTLDDALYQGNDQRILFIRDLVPRLRQIPGADAVAITSDLPATGPTSVTLLVNGQTDLPANQRLSALHNVVTPDYFLAAGIPLLRGRTFTDTDSATAAKVVVVNQEFVHRDLQNREPLGEKIQLDVSGESPEWSEIVGVVGNVKSYSEDTRDEPQVYEPFLQRPISSFSIMIRTSVDPNALATAIRSDVSKIDPDLPLDRLMNMNRVIERQRQGNPLFVYILGVFAFLALILAAIGIYGLVAYSVGQRTHEIGIRMALGAKARDVLRMLLWGGLQTSIAGGMIGLALALPLPRIFEALFFDLRLREPQLYFIVPIVILGVAMLATYIPARRASRMDPAVALHQN
jgi:predicted permease